MAIKAPTFSPDDQEYYPLHEEDDVPETVDDEGFLRFYTPEGETLLTHEEEARRREEAEQQRAEEARRRLEAEDRAADLERQLAELRARLTENGSDAGR